jgi:hypothetical protein
VIVIGFFLVLITLPYWVAFHNSGAGYKFGGFLLNPLDGNSYLAKMYIGWRGDWLFTLPYTDEQGRGTWLFTFYILLGHLARRFGWSLTFTFHSARLISAAFMLLALYEYTKAYLPKPGVAGLAFLLSSLGSGMGWLVLPFGFITPDFWVAETYPFLSAYVNPHFPLSLALLLFLLFPIKNNPDGQWWRISVNGKSLFTFVASFALACLSPFAIVIALVVWMGTTLLEVSESYRNRVKPAWTGLRDRMAWIVLGGLPVILYQLYVIRTDPLLSAWNSQNLTPAPVPWALAVALAPLLVLIPYSSRSVRIDWSRYRPLVVWAVVGVVLLYVPWGLQRRFMMGLYIPVCTLAVLALAWLVPDVRRLWFRGILLLILAVPTNLLILQAGWHGIQTRDEKLYLTKSEVDALDWIEANTPSRALILAGPDTGLLIPAYTGRRVVYGHPFETIHAEEQRNRVERLFKGEALPNTQALLNLADYVFYGPRERALGYNPVFDGLPVLYQNPDVTIFSARP